MYFIVGLILGMFFQLSPKQLQDAFPQEYLIRHYDIEDGLPVNSVNGLAQDDDSYLYITTYDGLVRYDGYEFSVFNSGNTDGMETNRIGGLIKASDNSIWLFNEDGSVTRKRNGAAKTYQNPEIPGSANWLVEGADGKIWVTGSEGIAYFEQETGTFTQLKDQIYQSDTGVAGAGLNGEVYAINREMGLVSWNDGEAKVLLGLDDFPFIYPDVREIRQFKENVLWVVGSQLLMKVNLVNQTAEQINSDELGNTSFWNIHQKHNGELILTANTGFYLLDSKNLSLQKLPVSINSNLSRSNIVFEGNEGESIFIGDDEVVIDGTTILQVPSIKFGFLDREGSLWVGSETDGLYQIRKSSFVNLTEEKIPGLHNTYSIIQDKKGAIWTCSLNSGITRISDGESRNWNFTNSTLPVNSCKFLFEDSTGVIYTGFTNNAIYSFSNGSWIPFVSSQRAEQNRLFLSEVMHQTDTRILIGHEESLMVLENGKLKTLNESRPLVLNGVQVIRENSKGVIFTGSSGNGLGRIEGNKIKAYTAEDGFLNSNIIRDIYLQSDDTLWVATENIGLNRLVLDEHGKVLSTASITTQNGLSHNSLHRIIEDSLGNIWLSSNGGIMRGHKKALNQFADGTSSSLPLIHFDEKDGMINREANGGVHSAGILTRDQKLWFPNQRGVTIIDPQNFQTQQTSSTPKPVIESIELGDDYFLVQQDSILTIPDHQRDLRVNFTAPNFAYQDRIHFSYKLEGVNQNWQSADQSQQAVFTALPPGNHTLRIRAEYTNSPPQEAVMFFTIPARFYETGWFFGLIFFALAGLVFGGFKYRLRHLQARERKLQHLVDEQTEELQKAAEQKSRFFTGITHELKTPLSLIVGPLDDMAGKPDAITPELIKSRLPIMHRNSQRLKHLINQILDVSKLNADAIKLQFKPIHLSLLTRQILGQFKSKLEQEQITLEFSGDEIFEPIYIDREAWERILINLMTNAIKFSPKNSVIRIEINEGEKEINLSVKDEGPGIQGKDQQRIFEYLYQAEGTQTAEGTGIGLFLVKGLLEHMGGEIALKSEEGKGAEFIITLKKGFRHIESIHTIQHEVSEFTPAKDFDFDTPEKTSDKGVESDSESAVEENILIVEDNADFRSFLTMILNSRYEVTVAKNGKEALKKIEESTPDLIISDVMMPGMNGLEFVNSLRGKKQFKHLPVIFLSAKNKETDMETGLSTGADAYLTKPIRSNMLLAQVEAVLRRERVLNEGFQPQATPSEPELLSKIRGIIYRQLANPSLTVSHLADALFISRAKLYAEWKEVSEITLNDFIKKQRMDEAHILLKDRGFNVQEAAHAVGFPDPNYFSTIFKKKFGYSPSEIKQ
ncbi:MAG: response regulator [Gracilimonas sp.]